MDKLIIKETRTDRLEAQDRPNYSKRGELRIAICKYKECGKQFKTRFIGLDYCMPAHRSWDAGEFPSCYDSKGNFTPIENVVWRDSK